MKDGGLLRGRLIGLALGILLVAASADAAKIEDVEFEDQITVGDRVLELQAVGLLRYRVFFKAYVAALYLEPGTPPQDALEAVPKRLEIEYFWPIAGRDFGPVAETVLERNVDVERLRSLRPQIEMLHEKYEDVVPGDRYVLTYLPGEGTELAKNGARLVVVPGEEFARDYFRIWLGEDPVDRKLRDQLLKRR